MLTLLYVIRVAYTVPSSIRGGGIPYCSCSGLCGVPFLYTHYSSSTID